MKYTFLAIYAASVFLASVAQILLKIGADRQYGSRIREYLNVPVISGYSLMAVSLLAGMLAYRGVPLSFGPVIESLGYVFVAALGWLFLKEKLSRRKLFGMALIIVGILAIEAAG